MECEKLVKELDQRQQHQDVEGQKAITPHQPQLFCINDHGGVTPLIDTIDYSLLFQDASLAMAICGLDGNFIQCNASFCKLSGYAMEELLTFTFFNLTPPEEMQAMYGIVSTMFTDKNSSPKRFWKQCIMKAQTVTVYVSMSLVRDDLDVPRYFHCVILPLPSTPFPESAADNVEMQPLPF